MMYHRIEFVVALLAVSLAATACTTEPASTLETITVTEVSDENPTGVTPDPERPLPAGVSTILEGFSDEPNPFAPDLPMPLWMSVALPSETSHADYHSEIVGRIGSDTTIGHELFSMLEPGASLVVTNLPLTAQSTTSRDFVIAASELPEEAATETGG